MGGEGPCSCWYPRPGDNVWCDDAGIPGHRLDACFWSCFWRDVVDATSHAVDRLNEDTGTLLTWTEYRIEHAPGPLGLEPCRSVAQHSDASLHDVELTFTWRTTC